MLPRSRIKGRALPTQTDISTGTDVNGLPELLLVLGLASSMFLLLLHFEKIGGHCGFNALNDLIQVDAAL
jgi:hypothetical protein